MTGERVAIVGQGYVGLPVAMLAVDAGFDVVGLDTDERRVNALRAGASYVDDVPASRLAAALASGRYLPTTDAADLEGFDVAVITVPTPLRDHAPDLDFITTAAHALGARLRAGATVVLESTTYPGTTEELLVPILEAESGLRAGIDFHVGYSPERIDPGNATWNLANTPKVVSGINDESLAAVQGFYDRMVERTVPVSGPKVAELSKLLENTFRHVNIALVNELAIFARQLDVDIWEAIDAASTKPFGYMRFTPGAGVGGHCLPIDARYLSWEVNRKLGRTFRFVELANQINDGMPDYVVQRLARLLEASGGSLAGARIALIGLAYKRNTGDTREAPSVHIVELLRAAGAVPVGFDRHVESHRWPEGCERADDLEAAIAGADAAILVTDHDDVDLGRLERADLPVLDTRHRLSGPLVESL